MKKLTIAVLSLCAALGMSVQAADVIPGVSSACGATATTTSTNTSSSMTEHMETIKSDVSTIKSDVQQGNLTNLGADKEKLGQDVNNAKEQLKSSFSFGSSNAGRQP